MREVQHDLSSTINAVKAIGVDPNTVAREGLTSEGYSVWVNGELKHQPWPSREAGQRVARAMRRDAERAHNIAPQPVMTEPNESDAVNHPAHYTSDPSGVECITITRHRNFDIGNAFKYLWRAGLKSDANLSPIEKQIEDLDKAIFYIEDEKKRLLAGKDAA